MIILVFRRFVQSLLSSKVIYKGEQLVFKFGSCILSISSRNAALIFGCVTVGDWKMSTKMFRSWTRSRCNSVVVEAMNNVIPSGGIRMIKEPPKGLTRNLRPHEMFLQGSRDFTRTPQHDLESHPCSFFRISIVCCRANLNYFLLFLHSRNQYFNFLTGWVVSKDHIG